MRPAFEKIFASDIGQQIVWIKWILTTKIFQTKLQKTNYQLWFFSLLSLQCGENISSMPISSIPYPVLPFFISNTYYSKKKCINELNLRNSNCCDFSTYFVKLGFESSLKWIQRPSKNAQSPWTNTLSSSAFSATSAVSWGQRSRAKYRTTTAGEWLITRVLHIDQVGS